MELRWAGVVRARLVVVLSLALSAVLACSRADPRRPAPPPSVAQRAPVPAPRPAPSATPAPAASPPDGCERRRELPFEGSFAIESGRWDDPPPNTAAIVLTERHAMLRLDYPLDTEDVSRLESHSPRGFTLPEIVDDVRAAYVRIYAQEARTTTTPPGLIPGMQNRNHTNGTYGISMHVIGDLVIESIEVWDCGPRGTEIRPGVGS